jgi:hypothetical protein
VQRRVPAADDRLGPGFFNVLEQLTGVDGNASVFWVMNASSVVGRVSAIADAEVVKQEDFDIGSVADGLEFNAHVQPSKSWTLRLGLFQQAAQSLAE